MEKMIIMNEGRISDISKALGISPYHTKDLIKKMNLYGLLCKVRDTRVAANKYKHFADMAVDLGVTAKTASKWARQWDLVA